MREYALNDLIQIRGDLELGLPYGESGTALPATPDVRGAIGKVTRLFPDPNANILAYAIQIGTNPEALIIDPIMILGNETTETPETTEVRTETPETTEVRAETTETTEAPNPAPVPVQSHELSGQERMQLNNLRDRKERLMRVLLEVNHQIMDLEEQGRTPTQELQYLKSLCTNPEFFISGRVVICVIDKPDEVAFNRGNLDKVRTVGFAIAHPEDTFDSTQGKILALKRALGLEKNPEKPN